MREKISLDDVVKGLFFGGLLVFFFSCLFSFLVYCWSTKEFKQYYMRNWDRQYCVYQNVENDHDAKAFCSTNPDEALSVYERLKK